MKDTATITGEVHEIREQLRIVQETMLLPDRSKSELGVPSRRVGRRNFTSSRPQNRA
jgi:hypothetical protein